MAKLKTSQIITLTLLASVSACSITKCTDDYDDDIPTTPKEEKVYTEQSCKDDYNLEEDCKKAASEANDEYLKIAPQYQSQEACNTAIGKDCISSPDHSGMFIPPLLGFVLGAAAGQAIHAAPMYYGPNPDCKTNPNDKACLNSSTAHSGGVFIYSRGGYYGSNTASGLIARSPSVSPVFARSPSVSSGFSSGRAISVSRGGFGAIAHGGGGGE